jgi:tetratricopeptide (TPR) repeat protein
LSVRVAVGAAFLVSLLAWPAAAQQDTTGDVHTIEIDLGNVENRIRLLEREVANPVAQSKFYPLEKRLVDGRVYFELKNYAKAAVLFIDAVDNPQFTTHQDRAEILFRLAFSLYKLRNFRAARDYFEQTVKVSSGSIYDKSLRYIIEIGLASHSGAGLEAAVQRIGKVPNRSPETQYAYGKGLYRLGRSQEALKTLGDIGPKSALYGASRYYTAVVLTDRKRYKEAIVAFKQSADVEPRNARDRLIIELSWLGMGRLHLETKDFGKAIDAYQEIPRNSKNFHTALYEMTWGFVQAEEFEKALNSLEILLLTVEDEQLSTQANILRGRLNILLDRTDDAVTTYNDIVTRFAPLRAELDKFATKPENLAAYFRWLLQRRVDAFDLGSVVSERASNWIENDEKLSDVVALFDDMSFQRKDVREAESILQEIDRALASGNRVEIFPNLKNAWSRIVIAENLLIQLSQRALDAEGRIARSTMSAGERQRLEEMLSKRQRLEKQFETSPKSVKQLRQRKMNVRRRYSDLKRESFILMSSLKQVRDDLRAMEKWLNEARYSAGSKKLDAAQMRKLTQLVAGEKRKLRNMYAELERLNTDITRQNAGVGAGDAVSEKEKQVRAQLLAAHKREEALLNGVLRRLVGGERASAERIQTVRKRIVEDFNRLGGLLERIGAAVDSRVGEYKRQLSAERKLLGIYRREVDSFERNSMRIAREVGQPLFRDAHRRLTDVVLEADLGLVDVAWKRKNAQTEKIQSLQQEQSGQLEKLQGTMREILK